MLMTRKSTDGGANASRSLVDALSRGVSRAIPTMDRRKFLRRSGLGVGAGMAATQLTLVRKADASEPSAAGGATALVNKTCQRLTTARACHAKSASRRKAWRACCKPPMCRA